ncbi:WhiB family transcriptional regulator [Streptomyces sp. NBC_00233]|uniref:WhiB family transcriptional regulator n=1 Tax=Streptomyces sp. NBC_00233 TaxID=2975686 RepID=UPI002253FBD1|nr:WhiB family transcriptional regulator [Streptomyces sp. NBC_00233]MCX5233366.1 WhiB family transcriptional regulator [Streptomyces sp. NBC_00233]
MPENSSREPSDPVRREPFHAPVGEQVWRARAACADRRVDPAIFYLADRSRTADASTDAKLVCRRCPVRRDCLEAAIEAGECYGTWGGMNPLERHRLGGPKPPRQRPRKQADSFR